MRLPGGRPDGAAEGGGAAGLGGPRSLAGLGGVGGGGAGGIAGGGAGAGFRVDEREQRVLGAIASKWAILILHRLSAGGCRFNALQRDLGGISQKVLAHQLRRLESHGLVSRVVHPTVPPGVEYSLTPAGHGLKEALRTLCEWAQQWIPGERVVPGDGARAPADGDGHAAARPGLDGASRSAGRSSPAAPGGIGVDGADGVARGDGKAAR